MTSSATRPSRVHFSSRTSAAFMIDLRAAANDWFRLTGTPGHATPAMVIKSAVMLSGFLGGYAALLWLQPGGWIATASTPSAPSSNWCWGKWPTTDSR